MVTFEPANHELTRAGRIPTGNLTRLLGDGGQFRLSELREDYHGSDFDGDVLQLVEEGEIALLPVGEYVCVKRQS